MRIKALERVNNKLRIINQTELPGRLVYRDLARHSEIIESIKRLEIRGAPAIGIAAAYALPIGVQESGRFAFKEVYALGERLKQARPTAVNLAWAVDRMLGLMRSRSPGSMEEALTLLWREAEAIHQEDRVMCQEIGRYGAALVHNGEAILTHCNTGVLATGGIGTALGIIYTCRDEGKENQIYVGETRPLLQGSRLTAWELRQEGIVTTLICDNAAGMLMRQGKVHHVVVGADRIARNGDTANKIGTYALAVLAREHGIPFYVAAPSSTIDRDTPTGAEIVIEERSSDEVTSGFGRRTAPEGVAVYAPAFDITPGRLVTAFITDKGVQQGPFVAG